MTLPVRSRLPLGTAVAALLLPALLAAGQTTAAAATSAAAGPVTATSTAAAGPGAALPATVDVAQTADDARHPLRLKVTGQRPDGSPLLVSTTPGGYTPAQVRAHLGLTGTGAGQTIAVVTAYDAPNAASDLATFNATFGLPAPASFRKVNQSGGTKLPTVNAGWALEAALDLQWAHAVAPDAGLLLVEASSSALANLLAGVSWAATQPGVSVVSGSFGTTEYSRQGDQDSRCRLTTGLCVFASGDRGNPGTYPATNPWALGVGGTTLQLDATGTFVSETGWSGSGGGVSLYAPKPGYQTGVTTAARRTSPDVAYDADPATGFPVYSSTAYDGQTGWFQMGGTSAGAPQWAGVLAAANQLRRGLGKGVLASATSTGTTPFHTALYAKRPVADIVSGSNGSCGALCTAGTGYDAVTGLGSPRGGVDVALRDLY